MMRLTRASGAGACPRQALCCGAAVTGKDGAPRAAAHLEVGNFLFCLTGILGKM